MGRGKNEYHMSALVNLRSENNERFLMFVWSYCCFSELSL